MLIDYVWIFSQIPRQWQQPTSSNKRNDIGPRGRILSRDHRHMLAIVRAMWGCPIGDKTRRADWGSLVTRPRTGTVAPFAHKVKAIPQVRTLSEADDGTRHHGEDTETETMFEFLLQYVTCSLRSYVRRPRNSNFFHGLRLGDLSFIPASQFLIGGRN